jgi:predicted HicB family RNase H-like nuclease
MEAFLGLESFENSNMKNILKHEGFIGSVSFSAEDEVFYGRLEGIEDLVTFEGSTMEELKLAFKEAVEDYLVICNEKYLLD